MYNSITIKKILLNKLINKMSLIDKNTNRLSVNKSVGLYKPEFSYSKLLDNKIQQQ